MLAKKWVLKKHFEGLPKPSDFELQEEELPPLREGEALFEAEWLSVDPYMRYYSDMCPEGATMTGEQVAKVIESRNPDIEVGDYYRCHVGWRTHTITDGKHKDLDWILMPSGEAIKLYDLGNLSRSLGLGTLGMPGATGYLGLVKSGQLKAGDTVYVNAAAGATGSVVGQVAKLKGCRVLGSAGTQVKCDWLREMGFDGVFNYRTIEDINAFFVKFAPDGINVFYDNVGGDVSHEIIFDHMAINGRVVVTGQIAHYNDRENIPQSPDILMPIKMKRLTVVGYSVFENPFHEWDAAFDEMKGWIEEGKMQYREQIIEGFENMPQAFIGVLKGDNIGKTVVKV